MYLDTCIWPENKGKNKVSGSFFLLLDEISTLGNTLSGVFWSMYLYNEQVGSMFYEEFHLIFSRT